MAVDDIYTKSLIHFNGADASTTFTDESGKSWSASGDAQIDSAQFKFGGASGLFDGTGDYISTADHADWRPDDGSNSNAWTMDWWIRFNANPNTTAMGIIQQYVTNSNFWGIYYSSGEDDLVFSVVESNVEIISIISTGMGAAISTGVWYHMALVKNGTAGYVFYLDGTAYGAAQTDASVIPDFAGSVWIGRLTNSSGTIYLNGCMDEFRFSKGVARWTANFTPPTREYGRRGGGPIIYYEYGVF